MTLNDLELRIFSELRVISQIWAKEMKIDRIVSDIIVAD